VVSGVRVALIVLVALALAAPAAAGNVATVKMTEVASWAAGRPLSVWCESEQAEWDRLLAQHGLSAPAGFIIDGFTTYTAPVVYLAPLHCPELVGPTHRDFALGLNVLLHESYTHYGAGIHDNAIQECGALLLQYEALRRFYGVPSFSPLMRRLTEQAFAFSQSKPASYLGGCSRL
jgi:hypothetical protein